MIKIKEVEWEIYKDIIITIMFVLFSIPIWFCFDRSIFDVADSYVNYNYINYKVYNNDNIQNLIISNDSYVKQDYNVVLKISNNINTKDIVIDVNNNINNLNSFKKYNDDTYNYFILDNSSIVANQDRYEIKLLDSNIKYEILVDNTSI